MSKILSGILGTLALSFSLGAVQYASGSDLVGLARQSAPPAAAQAGINREAKADRGGTPANTSKMRTISVSVGGLSDTSILVRVPLARQEARDSAPGLLGARQPVTRTVACEPVVSVLTEVAKQLQPGRCVT